MLVFLAGSFTINNLSPTGSSDAINVSSSGEYEQYNLSSAGSIFSLNSTTMTIMGVAVAVGIILAWVMKSPIPLGAAIFAGFVGSLYTSAASVIYSIIPSGNWIIAGIIGLLGICIAVLVGFTIIEYFAQQTGAD